MKKSYLVATVLTLAIAAWMAAGHLTASSRTDASISSAPAGDKHQLMNVEVRAHNAESVERHIVAQGQVEPNRAVTIRAETSGRIAAVVAEEGQAVKANDVIVRTEIDDRKARLKKVEALAREQQRAYDAAKRLGEKGYQTQRRIDETYSAFQTAQAELEEIRLEIAKTTIRAPFDGILEMRKVEIGDYVAVNGEIATIVDNDPLVVKVQIAQQDIGRLVRGGAVDVSFATGQNAKGVVRYIAPRADEATRTFRVEIEVANPDSQILSGTSAEARISTGTVKAHFISPALLSLSDVGTIGIKAVNDQDMVEFHTAKIVLAEARGVWVSGLPDAVRIITVGQGFVKEGDTVRVSLMQSGRANPDLPENETMLFQAKNVTERPR